MARHPRLRSSPTTFHPLPDRWRSRSSRSAHAWLMNRRSAEDPRHVARLLAWTTGAMTIPSMLLYWVNSESSATILLWAFVPAVYFYIGPVLGLLQNAVPASMRATSCALALFTANVANLIIAPQFIGWLSDWFALSFGAGKDSLRWALLLLAPSGFWAAWHFWRCGVTIRDDQHRAGSA